MKNIIFVLTFLLFQKVTLAQKIKFDTRNATYIFLKDYPSIEMIRLFDVIDSAFKYLPSESMPNGSKKIEVREIRVIPTSKEKEFLYNQSYIFGKKGDTAFFREEYMTGSMPRFQNNDWKLLKTMITDFIEKLILEAKLIRDMDSPQRMN